MRGAPFPPPSQPPLPIPQGRSSKQVERTTARIAARPDRRISRFALGGRCVLGGTGREWCCQGCFTGRRPVEHPEESRRLDQPANDRGRPDLQTEVGACSSRGLICVHDRAERGRVSERRLAQVDNHQVVSVDHYLAQYAGETIVRPQAMRSAEDNNGYSGARKEHLDKLVSGDGSVGRNGSQVAPLSGFRA